MKRARARDDSDLGNRVLRIVRKKKSCDLDELIQECSSYTWTQIFLVVDQLSRTGEVRLLSKKAGEYILTLPQAA